ncbi:hypothetical protein BDR06DRAFT_967424 [Suillus hirtellus]|nr:hypothetical protein BDR06DRAFT_967424 [Suillus hirtellus]
MIAHNTIFVTLSAINPFTLIGSLSCSIIINAIDGLGGKLFPMEVDGWAEVVGYYADGCIKVDVYEIDGWVGQGYYKILDYTDWWAEGVVWDVVLDGWAEGGIQYRWVVLQNVESRVVLQNVESGVRSLCCPMRSQVPTTKIAAGDLLIWQYEACVALRDAKFRPPKYGSTVPTSEFWDPGVDK